MAGTAEFAAAHPALEAQLEIVDRPAPIERRMANAVRALALDAAEAAQSERSVLPLSMADVATVLWTRFLKFDAAAPRWPDRDRFVLSAGHGSMLLYGLLHLTGHPAMGMDELMRFRQLHAVTAGHPEFGDHPAIEATTGPLGLGIATGVGMALAERMMAARFGRSLVDHRTWIIASDGDLMEGVCGEAIGLAGHLRLDKLTILYDDNGVSNDGHLSLTSSSDQVRRFTAHGWAVKQVDGHDHGDIASALSFALRSKKPTLIACRTDLYRDEPLVRRAKEALGWHEPPFSVPAPISERWKAAGTRGASSRRAWLKRLARHPLRPEFERVNAGRLPDAWHEGVAALKAELAETRPSLATRKASHKVLEALAPVIPELAGGSADLTELNLAQAKGMISISPGNFAGRYIHFGVREHAMAAACNGMALHGGLLPYGATFLAFSDYMRPALRLGALMGQRVIHVLTHDSIGLGGDGATHQPMEHLPSLRAMPNLNVFRPADGIETAECWELAIRRSEGPSLLVLSLQDVPTLRGDATENRCARGGYVLAEAEGPRQATLIATGSEVSLAMEARELLAGDRIPVAVVSLPCWELFMGQDAAYRAQVLGGVPRFGIEAAGGFGWERWIGEDGIFIGMNGFGASAPGEDLYRHFGITADAIAACVRKRLG